MWLLSCIGSAGDLLQGKRLWLRPGTSHLIGRTSSKPVSGERCVYINDNAVSRKHVVFRVADPKAGSSTRLYERTALTVVDASKKGTHIDGEKLEQGEKVLDGSKESYEVRLGLTEWIFKVEWKDVVLSFTNIGKNAKKAGTALAEEKAKLEGCDIKLATEYVTNITTHVVAKKRNTAAGLQALVQARWLVTEAWINALADVVKRRASDQPSPLEEDFDGMWPKEAEFLVPTSGEPVARPDNYLKPDPARAEVFADYTFIFMSKGQYDSLLPVITAGAGKAVVFEYQPGHTANDIVDFASELCGKKGQRGFLLSQEPAPGGIVIVRITDKEDNRAAAKDAMSEVSIALNQRTIEQSELLDAILTKDAANLRRPLRGSTQSSRGEQQTPQMCSNSTRSARNEPITVRDSPPTESQRPPRSGQNPPQTQQQPTPEEAAPEEPEPPTTRRRRIMTQPRKFTGFDDFDPTEFADPEVSQAPPASVREEPSQAPSVQQPMEIDEEPEEAVNTQRNSRKRPAPVEEPPKEEEIDETLYPGAAASKRRKTEEARRKAAKKSNQPTPDPEVTVTASKTAKGKNGKVKADPETDVKALMRKRREEEDEARRKDEEALQETLNVDLANIHIEHKIEQFDPIVPPPRDNATQAERERDREGWNDAWNGRKNFKRFRSNKSQRQAPEAPESQRVIISLVPIPGRSQGLGDDYWLETGQENEKRRGNKSQSQTQRSRTTSQQADGAVSRQSGTAGFGGGDSDEDDGTAFRRRLQRSREEDEDDAEITDQTLIGDAQKGRKATGKRPAGQSGLDALLGEAPPAKKPRAAASKSTGRVSRIAAALQAEESEEEDPTAFRRKRR